MTVPCMNCGSTEYIISMITDCDKCNPDLSIERFIKMDDCKHENQKPSNIIGINKCLDCGMVGCNVFGGKLK